MSWQIKAENMERMLKEVASSFEDDYTEEVIVSRQEDGSFQVTGDKVTFWDEALLPEEAKKLREENKRLNVLIERANKKKLEYLDCLAEIRDTILGLHKTDGSDEFYEHWLMQTVPRPDLVPDLVKAEIKRYRESLENILRLTRNPNKPCRGDVAIIARTTLIEKPIK